MKTRSERDYINSGKSIEQRVADIMLPKIGKQQSIEKIIKDIHVKRILPLSQEQLQEKNDYYQQSDAIV